MQQTNFVVHLSLFVEKTVDMRQPLSSFSDIAINQNASGVLPKKVKSTRNANHTTFDPTMSIPSVWSGLGNKTVTSGATLTEEKGTQALPQRSTRSTRSKAPKYTTAASDKSDNETDRDQDPLACDDGDDDTDYCVDSDDVTQSTESVNDSDKKLDRKKVWM